MGQYESLATSVCYIPRREEILLINYSRRLTFIGKGRSAAVFKINHEDKVIKIFNPALHYLANIEADIYYTLRKIPYYPTCYESGENYLVIDYIEGKTMYQFLVEGKLVTESMIAAVDDALEAARNRGLNPSDIHLRNIIITGDASIRLIDVTRFRQPKQCNQWGDLKKAFHSYYQKRYFPKKIPPAFIELIAKSYRRNLLSFLM